MNEKIWANDQPSFDTNLKISFQDFLSVLFYVVNSSHPLPPPPPQKIPVLTLLTLAILLELMNVEIHTKMLRRSFSISIFCQM